MASASTVDSLPAAVGGVDALLASLAPLSDRPALSFYLGKNLKGRLTYGALLSRVEEIASYLEHELGVAPGDRILLLTPNRLEVPAVLLALMRLRAVIVPLNPTTSPEDWSYIAGHSQARGLIATGELKSRAGLTGLKFSVEIENFFSLPSARKISEKDSADGKPAIILYTSGTTGNPKGVTLTQRNLLRNGWSMAENFALKNTTQFAVLPLYHAHALGFGLMTSLTSGGHLVFTEKLDPFAWSEIIRAESVVYTSVVPSLLPSLLAARVHREKLPSLRAMMVSSAPLSVSSAREFEEKTAIPLIQGWGLSEYTNFACCLSPADSPEDHVDLNGNPVGENQPGELCVRGHSLMLGYYGNEAATQDTMLDGWLKTGDQGLFRIYRGKAVFFVTGRIKEIIIRSGDKYSPLAIEKKLFEKIPELEGKLVVVGFVHKVHGEEVGAYLESAELSVSTRDRLSQAIESLPIELRPKVVLYGASPIPRTHTGKIQRRKLQPLYSRFADTRGMLKIESA
jgi:long-chain acyl-CoA synthetase